ALRRRPGELDAHDSLALRRDLLGDPTDADLHFGADLERPDLGAQRRADELRALQRRERRALDEAVRVGAEDRAHLLVGDRRVVVAAKLAAMGRGPRLPQTGSDGTDCVARSAIWTLSDEHVDHPFCTVLAKLKSLAVDGSREDERKACAAKTQ